MAIRIPDERINNSSERFFAVPRRTAVCACTKMPNKRPQVSTTKLRRNRAPHRDCRGVKRSIYRVMQKKKTGRAKNS
jgi:hypothetical protein